MNTNEVSNPTKNQVFPLATVSIMVGRTTGVRYAHITPTGSRRSYDVPVSMLSLAAGKDAWMRDVLVKCSECRTPVKAGDMECELCPTCYDRAGEENHRLDNPAPAPRCTCSDPDCCMSHA